MVIAHNISAMNTYNKMGISSSAADKSMEKLSSGYAINRAADDAAGLSISEKMRSQIRGLNQASENAENGISMIQTAEGALNETHSILQRMRELAVQAANDTNATSDRESLQSEIDQLTSEINRIGNTTEFNGMKLLNGSKITTDGTEEVTVAKGNTIGFSLGNAQGVTNTAGLELKDGTFIKFSDTSGNSVDYNNLMAANKDGDGNTINTLVVSKKDGKLTLNAKLVEATSAAPTTATTDSITIDSEELIQNADGDWTYNNHGISFTITEESAQEFITNGDDSDTLTLDLFKAKGSKTTAVIDATASDFAIDNEYESDSSANGSITNIKLDSFGTGTTRLDYNKVEIEYDHAAAGSAATINVTYYAEDGSQLVKDTITVKAEDTTDSSTGDNRTAVYSANGLSFQLNMTKGMGTSEKIHAIIDLDEKNGTETVKVDGTAVDNSVYFHVGANTNQVINTTFGDMRANALKLTGTGDAYTSEASVNDGTSSDATENGLNISTRAGANSAIEIIDNAITAVSQERSKYGSIQNRLEYTINNLDTTSENMTSAESTIRDVDMASEMMELTKNQILQQASQAMLSQAMQTPQQVLQLLQ